MYGIKYYSEFRNVDNQLIRFEILKKDYSGAFEGLNLDGGDPLRLVVKEKDRDESIISKGGVINVYQEAAFKFIDLFNVNELEYQVRIYKDIVLIYMGWIEPELFDSELTHENTIVSISFSDHLQILNRYNFDEANISAEYVGYYSLIEILKAILIKTGVNLPIYINSSLFEKDMTQEDSTFFEQTYLSKKVFQSKDIKSVLEEVLKGHRLTQTTINGNIGWVIERLKDMGKSNKTYIRYNTNGTKTTINVTVNPIILSQDALYLNKPSFTSKSGYRKITAKVDVLDIGNFVPDDASLASALNYDEVLTIPPGYTIDQVLNATYTANTIYKHSKINIVPDGNKFDVAITAGLPSISLGSSFGGCIMICLNPFTFVPNRKDVLEIKVTYEIPDDVLNANKNHTAYKYVSLLAIKRNQTTNLYRDMEGNWVVQTINVPGGIESFELDYTKAFVREDERSFTHVLSIPMIEVQSAFTEYFNYFKLYIMPLRYGQIGTHDGWMNWQSPINNNTTPLTHFKIKEVNFGINEEIAPDNVFMAELNEDFYETKEITTLLADFQSANYANNMYIARQLGTFGKLLFNTKEWSDDGENFYDYNSKFLIDNFQIYSQGRFSINSDIICSLNIDTNTIFQEIILGSEILFYISGYEYDLNRNEYSIKLDQYVNNEEFIVNQ